MRWNDKHNLWSIVTQPVTVSRAGRQNFEEFPISSFFLSLNPIFQLTQVIIGTVLLLTVDRPTVLIDHSQAQHSTKVYRQRGWFVLANATTNNYALHVYCMPVCNLICNPNRSGLLATQGRCKEGDDWHAV